MGKSEEKRGTALIDEYMGGSDTPLTIQNQQVLCERIPKIPILTKKKGKKVGV